MEIVKLCSQPKKVILNARRAEWQIKIRICLTAIETKKIQINIQTEMHQIYKEVPKKSLILKKNSLLLKAHNIITDLKIDLKVFFFFF